MKHILLTLLVSLSFLASCPGGIVVVGSLARNNTVKPGDSFEGILLLRNSDTNAADVRIYQSDYLFGADGTNLYGEPGTTPRSNAEWITLSPTRLTIAPGQTASVHYKGKVPNNQELTGTYWSMAMIEPSVAAGPALNGQKDKIEVGLQTLVRFAVQIVTQIGDTGKRSIKVVDKKLIHKDGKRTLQLDVQNTGERMLVPAAWVELFNDKGVSIGKFEAGRWRIYPACSVRYSADLSEVPLGRYSALVIADNGDDHVMGAQYELQIEK